MASPNAVESPRSVADDDSPRLRTFSRRQARNLSDRDYFDNWKVLFSDVSRTGIESLLKDPRAQLGTSRSFSDPHRIPQSPLEAAVEKDDFTAVRAILRNQRGAKQAAIAFAIEQGSVQVVRSLVSVREVNTRDEEGKTYLHQAAAYGQLSVAKCLVEEKFADPSLKSPVHLLGSRPPVQVAVNYGHKEVFEYLLLLGDQEPREWQSLLFKMLATPSKPQSPQLPLQPRLDIQIISSLCRNSVKYTYDLIDVNHPKEDGTTLLHIAALDAAMIELLLKCGANPFARDKTGKTPLDAWPSLGPSEVSESYIRTFLQFYEDTMPKMDGWAFPNGEIDLSERLDIHVVSGAKVHWISMPENNDAFFSAVIALASKAQGYDRATTATALRFLSRTFMQHDGAGHLQRFRETSYNAFSFPCENGGSHDGHKPGKQITIDSNESSITDHGNVQASNTDNDLKNIQLNEQESSPALADTSFAAQQQSEADKSRPTVNGISFVLPYFSTELRSLVLDKRQDLKQSENVRKEPKWNHLSTYGPTVEAILKADDPVTETKLASEVSRRKKARALNIHEPHTLDESYHLGFSQEQITERNTDQVLSRYDEANGTEPRLLMVSQLWLWSMGDFVISACLPQMADQNEDARSDVYQGPDSPQDPQSSLHQEFKSNNLQRSEVQNNMQLTALIISECINNLDQPNYAGLDESIFHVFEHAVGDIYDQVKKYMKKNDMNNIQIKEEMKFIHDISDIREELAMMRTVIAEQEEVWGRFWRDLKKVPETQYWNTNNRLVAKRPKYQLPKFKRRIQKIDEDAQRIEQWILGQLDLKKTHASLQESHASLRESQNSTVLSTAVIGFTTITIIFTPLSFMTSLLAVPESNFTWGNSGKTWITVVELVSLTLTAVLIMLSLWYLRRSRLREITDTTPAPVLKMPDTTDETRKSLDWNLVRADAGEKTTNKVQSANSIFGRLRRRKNKTPGDPEHASSTQEADTRNGGAVKP